MYSMHNSMTSLLDSLRHQGVVKSQAVYNAMLQVDRADFISNYPYADSPQSISYGATISAPHMHAYALEYLAPAIGHGCRILDVGSGSGYLTVALSKLTGDTGQVVGIEHIDELVEFGRRNIMKHHADLLNKKNIILVKGDGRMGCKEFGPYKAIHVGAAPEQIPNDLLAQLDFGGRMVIPVGGRHGQSFQLVKKDLNGIITKENVLSVNYVPLTSKEHQLCKGY